MSECCYYCGSPAGSKYETRCVRCETQDEDLLLKLLQDQVSRLTAEVERLTKEVTRLEAVPIKCIWCNLRMATVDEAAAHVVECVKSPNHPLMERIAALENGIRSYQSEQENPIKDVAMIRVTRQRLFALLAPQKEAK